MLIIDPDCTRSSGSVGGFFGMKRISEHGSKSLLQKATTMPSSRLCPNYSFANHCCPPIRSSQNEISRAALQRTVAIPLPLLRKDPNRPIKDGVDIVDIHVIAPVTAESGSS